MEMGAWMFIGPNVYRFVENLLVGLLTGFLFVPEESVLFLYSSFSFEFNTFFLLENG